MGVAVNMKAVFDDDLRTKPQTLASLVYPVRDTKLLCVDIEGISVDTDLIAKEKIYCKEKKNLCVCQVPGPPEGVLEANLNISCNSPHSVFHI